MSNSSQNTKTPVAFFVFNRPETTELVFQEIRKARPATLLLVCDGPRPEVPSDIQRVEEVKRILDHVDWPCDVLKNYSEANLGCRQRIQSGLSWVFSEVEKAIILEDDCLPSPSFFPFMDKALSLYAHDDAVGMISGTSYLLPSKTSSDKYYFSALPHIWGWGTWRRVWQDYEPDAESWVNTDQWALLKRVFAYGVFRKSWKSTLDNIAMASTWDYQWAYSLWLHERLSLVPRANLVRNVGMDQAGTHTFSSSSHPQNPMGRFDAPEKLKRKKVKRSNFRDFAELTVFRAFAARQLGFLGTLKHAFSFRA